MRRPDAEGAEVSDVYTGQVERDPHGALWAVLYRGEVTHPDAIVSQEPTRSVKRGRKRVAEMILAQVDADRRLTASGTATARDTGRRMQHTLGFLALHPRALHPRPTHS